MSCDRERDGVGGDADLVRLLRREAARDRPAFAADLHGRIVAAVAAAGRGRKHRVGPRSVARRWVCAVVLGIGGVLWLASVPAPGPAFVTAREAAEPPPIDQVLLLDEIGAELVAGTVALATEVVGLPRWNELVDAGAAFMPPGDGWPATGGP
jgi:hypothetical protein